MIAPTEDYTLLTDDAALDSVQLRSLAETNNRVQALQQAYPNEIVNRDDIVSGTAYNSYQSLMSGHLFTPPPYAADAIPSGTPELREPTAPAANESAPTPTPEESVSHPDVTASPEISVSPTATPEEPTPIPTDTPVES